MEFDLHGNIFLEFAIILILSAIFGAAARLLRQPLIVSFIVVGIVLGPSVLGITTAFEEIELLAKMGIAILLFVVGLKLDVGVVQKMGIVALASGLGQVIFTALIGYVIAIIMGFTPINSLYIAVALTFSSTIIIIKLLSDKREIDALHGRIAVGILIIQDIIVILVLILLSAFGTEVDESSSLTREILMVAGKGIAFLAVLILLTRYVLSHLVKMLAKSQELLILFAIAWAIFLGAVSHMLGFTEEVGAFLAGASLANTHYREIIGARLSTIRDFLLLFFFINLGGQLDLRILGLQIVPSLIFSAFVLIGNPIIVMIITRFMGFHKRTGFLAGVALAQISEFSLILSALGFSLGHIDEETMGLITLVGLITIGLSTYLIIYSGPIYNQLAPYLSIFEKKNANRAEEDPEPDAPVDVILFGLGRYGSNIAKGLIDCGNKVLGVDFNPGMIDKWHKMKLHAQYGDAEDPDVHHSLPIDKTKWVISTLPDLEVNMTLLKALREHKYEGRIGLTAHNEETAEELRKAGADLILYPFVDAADRAVEVVREMG